MTPLAPLSAADGAQIHAVFAPAQGPIRAAIHLNHGMGEHSGRFGDVIAALSAAGYSVLAHDHRGHGQTAALNGVPLGHMTAGGATMETWVADMRVAADALRAQAGEGVKTVLLGHSMGSFFAQRAAQAHPELYDALILSGSTGRPTVKQNLSTYITRLEALFRGKNAPAKLFHELTFQEFNRPFKGDGHRQAWLSRDPEIWAAYTADPLCDYVVYVGAYLEVARMIRANFTQDGLGALNTAMPTLMFGGTRDALSDMGPGLQRLHDAWADLGFADLSLTFWEGARHECLNETNRQDVIADMIGWLDARFG